MGIQPFNYRKLILSEYYKKLYQKHSYGCLMAVLPDNLSKQIIKWAKETIKHSHLHDKELELDPHITIKYGFIDDGEDTINMLKMLLLRNGPIKVKLKTLSLFKGTENGDVLKIEIESSDLTDLHVLISSLFPCNDPYKEYQPHITIAYLKPNFSASYTAQLAEFLNQEIVIHDVKFCNKKGVEEIIPLSFIKEKKAMSAYAETSGGALVPPPKQKKQIPVARSPFKYRKDLNFDQRDIEFLRKNISGKRQEGVIFQGPSGKWFVVIDGRVRPAKDPSKGGQSQGGQKTPKAPEQPKQKKQSYEETWGQIQNILNEKDPVQFATIEQIADVLSNASRDSVRKLAKEYGIRGDDRTKDQYIQKIASGLLDKLVQSGQISPDSVLPAEEPSPVPENEPEQQGESQEQGPNQGQVETPQAEVPEPEVAETPEIKKSEEIPENEFLDASIHSRPLKDSDIDGMTEEQLEQLKRETIVQIEEQLGDDDENWEIGLSVVLQEDLEKINSALTALSSNKNVEISESAETPPAETPPAETPEPQVKTKEDAGERALKFKINQILNKAEANSENPLSKETRELYQKNIEELVSAMTGKARKVFFENLKTIEFFNSNEELNNSLTSLEGKRGEEIRKKAKGKNIAAAWNKKTGTLFLDGSTEKQNIRDIYAHAVTNSINHKPVKEIRKREGKWTRKKFSDEDNWQRAFDKEFKNGQLSKYASNSPDEAFAEFGRLVYGRNSSIADVKQKFPNASAIWDKLGFLPKESPKQVPIEKLPEIFDDSKLTAGDLEAISLLPTPSSTTTSETTSEQKEPSVQGELFESEINQKTPKSNVSKSPSKKRKQSTENASVQGELFKPEGEINEPSDKIEDVETPEVTEEPVKKVSKKEPIKKKKNNKSPLQKKRRPEKSDISSTKQPTSVEDAPATSTETPTAPTSTAEDAPEVAAPEKTSEQIIDDEFDRQNDDLIEKTVEALRKNDLETVKKLREQQRKLHEEFYGKKDSFTEEPSPEELDQIENESSPVKKSTKINSIDNELKTNKESRSSSQLEEESTEEEAPLDIGEMTTEQFTKYKEDLAKSGTNPKDIQEIENEYNESQKRKERIKKQSKKTTGNQVNDDLTPTPPEPQAEEQQKPAEQSPETAPKEAKKRGRPKKNPQMPKSSFQERRKPKKEPVAKPVQKQQPVQEESQQTKEKRTVQNIDDEINRLYNEDYKKAKDDDARDAIIEKIYALRAERNNLLK